MRKGLNIAENDRQAARLVGRADLIDADQSELGNAPDAFADFRRVADLAIKDLADSIECDLLDDVALDTHPRLVDRAATEQTNRLTLEPARPGECVVSAVVRNPANAQNFHMCGSGGKCRPRSRVRE